MSTRREYHRSYYQANIERRRRQRRENKQQNYVSRRPVDPIQYAMDSLRQSP